MTVRGVNGRTCNPPIACIFITILSEYFNNVYVQFVEK